MRASGSGVSGTTTPCWSWSAARTSPAASTPAAAGVAVGAQVSYRDLAGFGRRFIDVAPSDLADDVLYQLAALDGIARSTGTRVSYVKPHGALYNAAVTHEGQAGAVVDAVLAFDRRLPVLGLPGSALLRAVEAAGMRPVAEGFADRGYRPVIESVLKQNADKFPTPPDLFTIADLGGWEKVTTEFFDPENGKVAAIERDLGVATE